MRVKVFREEKRRQERGEEGEWARKTLLGNIMGRSSSNEEAANAVVE